jgi:DNA-binding transcriptional ArsR family regulator
VSARATASVADSDDAELAAALSALGDPTRRAVVRLLGMQPRRAGELAQALQMSPPALSRHLRVLRRSGLIADDEPAHDARVRLYRLQPQALAPLRQWLDEVEAFWDDQLAAFKAHAERSNRAGPSPGRVRRAAKE